MTFVLVHGAYHGSWCWDRLIPELERRGFDARAVDLPVGDPDAGAREYAKAIADQTADLETVVLVAHSASGIAAPLVPSLRPVDKIVFLAAFLPQPGLSFNQVREAEPVDPDHELQDVEFEDLGHGVWMIGPNTAREMFVHDATSEDAAWACARLRPQAYKALEEVTPLDEYPAVDYAYIVCRDDHAINPAWARDAARKWLGVEALEMDGGHSPFLTRPRELAATLAGLVT